MLRADIIGSSLEPKFEDTVRMIHSHVRHVEIKYVLDWDLVAGLLLKCRRLKTLRHANYCTVRKRVDDSNSLLDGTATAIECIHISPKV
jgi:hypothetical protein